MAISHSNEIIIIILTQMAVDWSSHFRNCHQYRHHHRHRHHHDDDHHHRVDPDGS